jgi:hypothetical protein
LVGADLTCAKHGVHGAAHASQPSTSPHADHQAPPQSTGAAEDDTCEVPTFACCQALASCGVSVADEHPAGPGDLSHLATGVLSGADDAPMSWTLEPEPPPPKA